MLVDISLSDDAGIVEYGFANLTRVTSVTLTEGLVNIDRYAFNNVNKLPEIVLPASVANLGEYAFTNCTSLATITFMGDNVETFSEGLFYNCEVLTTMLVGSETEQNKENVINVPDSVITIEDYAFFNNVSMKEIVVSDNTTSLGYAFLGGNTLLETITVPFIGATNNESEISETTVFGHFFGKSDLAARFKNSIRAIEQIYGDGKKAAYCIPTSVKNVNDTLEEVVLYGTFYNVDSIIDITLPINVNHIYDYAFAEMNNLETVTFVNGTGEISLAHIDAYAFNNDVKLTNFNSVEGDEFDINLPSTLLTIGEHAFENVDSITSVIIPSSVAYQESVEVVGVYAFANNDVLETVSINND